MEGIDTFLVIGAIVAFLVVALLVIRMLGGKRGGSSAGYSGGGSKSSGPLLFIVGSIVVVFALIAGVAYMITGSERERANIAAQANQALQQSNDRMFVDLQKANEQNRVLADENSDLRADNINLRSARDVQMMQLTMPMILVGAGALVIVALVGGALYVMIFRVQNAPQAIVPQQELPPGQAEFNQAVIDALRSIDGRLKIFEGRGVQAPAQNQPRAMPYKPRYPPPQLKGD